MTSKYLAAAHPRFSHLTDSRVLPGMEVAVRGDVDRVVGLLVDPCRFTSRP